MNVVIVLPAGSILVDGYICMMDALHAVCALRATMLHVEKVKRAHALLLPMPTAEVHFIIISCQL